jgi:hypothetical protein
MYRSVTSTGRLQLIDSSKSNLATLKEKSPLEAESRGETDSSVKTAKQQSNPIHWYGLFVPKSLQDTQTNFVSAVDSIPRLLNIAGDMRQLEIEIGRKRKSIKKLEKAAAAALEPSILPPFGAVAN